MKPFLTLMSEMDMITEVFVRGGKPNEGAKVLSKGKNIWVWNNKRELKKLLPFINKEFGTDFENGDDIIDWYSDGADVVLGEIVNGSIELAYSNRYSPSASSKTLKKVIDALRLNRVTKYASTVTVDDDIEHQIELSRSDFNKKLGKQTFYHGTSTTYIESMLKTGIRAIDGNTQFDAVQHTDKVFVTTSLDKALYHATHSANKNASYPVIIELKIPDENKLVSDYDVVIDTLGADSQEADDLGYTDIYYKNVTTDSNGIHYDDMHQRYGKRIGNLSTRFGIFGYKGRIPSKFFKYIICDDDVIIDDMSEHLMNTGETEFDLSAMESSGANHRNIDYWNRHRPKSFIPDLESQYDEFVENDDDDW